MMNIENGGECSIFEILNELKKTSRNQKFGKYIEELCKTLKPDFMY